MDLTKIGAYIASKRKTLGITQVELARQLGMSDKSVSKWERGVCLPDVSLYEPLCDILGITINEFIAGEDLDHDTIMHQAEKNILDVASAAKAKYNKLQIIFLAITVIYFVITCWLALAQPYLHVAYIDQMDQNSQEMMIAGALNDAHNLFGYRYKLQYYCRTMSFHMTESKGGEVLSSRCVAEIPYSYNVGSGMFLITAGEDLKSLDITIVSSAGNKAFEILLDENAENISCISKMSSDITRNNNIKKGEEIGLVRLACEDPEHSYLLSVTFE